MIRIAGIIKESIVDGPGIRYVIFSQGCPHRCDGCHNSHTHSFYGGYVITIDELFSDITAAKLITGVTFSGGEPFSQAQAFAKLAKLIKEKAKNLDIVAYSGYYYHELLNESKKNHYIKDLLCSVDILIDGPYDKSKRNLNLPFRGSDNQNIIKLHVS